MPTTYESDHYGWTKDQASLIRSGNLNQLDTKHLLEEIEAMGISEENELESRLEVLLMHMLKWQYQSERQSKSWTLTIKEQRRKISRRLKKSPSLKNKLAEIIEDSYGDAVISAERETNIKGSVFPVTCPWTSDQIMDANFYPE